MLKKNSVVHYFYPFAAALSIAFYFIFGEHLSAKIDPFVISSLVTFFSGILLLLFYSLKYSPRDIKTEISQKGFYLLIIGIFLCAGYFFSFLALNRTTASSVTIFTAVEPVICIFFAYFGFIVPKEPLSKRTLFIMAALVGSVVLSKLSMGTGTALEIKIGLGELLAVLSAVAYAFAILVSKRVLKSDVKKAIIVVGAALTEVFYQSKILFVFLLSLAASHFGLLKLKTIPSPLLSFTGIILIIVFSILLVISHNKDME